MDCGSIPKQNRMLENERLYTYNIIFDCATTHLIRTGKFALQNTPLMPGAGGCAARRLRNVLPVDAMNTCHPHGRLQLLIGPCVSSIMGLGLRERPEVSEGPELISTNLRVPVAEEYIAITWCCYLRTYINLITVGFLVIQWNEV